MGDPALADPAKIEDLPWLDSPEWTLTPGYLHVKSNYLLLIDNLLDLTHVTYVHKNTIAGDPREAITPTKTERVEGGIRNGRWMIDFDPPPLFAKAGKFTGRVDRWQHVTWKAPATVYLDVGCAKTGTGAPEGDRSQGISIWSTHLVIAGDGDVVPLHVRLRAQLPTEGRGDVEAAVRRLAQYVHGGPDLPGAAAGKPAWRRVDRGSARYPKRRCSAADAADDAPDGSSLNRAECGVSFA